MINEILVIAIYLPKLLCGLETFVVCDGEDAEESLSTAEIVVPDGRVVLLSCCVKNVNLYFFAVQNHLKCRVGNII